jgi:hypothetical protein
MRLNLTGSKRIALLNEIPSPRPWRSCSETRRCVVCDKVFTADKVRINRLRDGRVVLRCPTLRCAGGPQMWGHAGEPLVSQEAWNDWERILNLLDQCEGDDQEIVA